MSAIHAGFFAFPAAHVETLDALYGRWGEAVDALADDVNLRRNEMYRAAREVALRVGECHGKSAWLASVGIFSFLLQACWRDRDQGVFSPEDTRSFAEAVDKLEKRRGMDKLVKGIAREAPLPVEPEIIIQVYETFREVLRFAAANNLAMTWAVLRDNAEAELEERRRQDELMRLEDESLAWAPARPPITWPPVTESPLKAYIERENAKLWRREVARSKLPDTLWLAVVPDAQVEAIRTLIRKCFTLGVPETLEEGEKMPPWDEDELRRQGEEMTRQAYQLLDEHAVTRAKLTKMGEETILGELGRALEDRDKTLGDGLAAPGWRGGTYSSERAAALLEATEAWEAEQGGEAAAVGTLVGDTEVAPRMATRAYRVLKNMLRAAKRHGRGLVLMGFDPDPPSKKSESP